MKKQLRLVKPEKPKTENKTPDSQAGRMNMSKKPRKPFDVFTVEPGREIYKNGQPFIGITREGNTRPVDADEVTHIIASLLNGEA